MKKKSLLTMLLALTLVAVVGVGATLAYLSDSTGAMTNTFTVGSGIDITQDEEDIDYDYDKDDDGKVDPEYDEDGDGWIDEDDAIWSRLKIWCKDENGRDILYTLRDKGVGAICLQNAATGFALNDEQNTSKGYIRSTGIFLYENGNVGTVQHLDLVQ